MWDRHHLPSIPSKKFSIACNKRYKSINMIDNMCAWSSAARGFWLQLTVKAVRQESDMSAGIRHAHPEPYRVFRTGSFSKSHKTKRLCGSRVSDAEAGGWDPKPHKNITISQDIPGKQDAITVKVQEGGSDKTIRNLKVTIEDARYGRILSEGDQTHLQILYVGEETSRSKILRLAAGEEIQGADKTQK